jgi:hypothetical protein
MFAIAKESLAPRHYEILRQGHRANTDGRVPEIVFSLFLSGGIRKRVGLEQIAAQATVTYPSDFHTWVAGDRVPDLALMLLALNEACSPNWHYVIGDWSCGWHLTKKGLRFAQDVERRRIQRGNA